MPQRERRGGALPGVWHFSEAVRPLRGDPRFSAAMIRMGLPAFWDVYGWPEACRRVDGEVRCS